MISITIIALVMDGVVVGKSRIKSFSFSRRCRSLVICSTQQCLERKSFSSKVRFTVVTRGVVEAFVCLSDPMGHLF